MKNAKALNETKRNFCMDAAEALAIVSVIMIHISAAFVAKYELGSRMRSIMSCFFCKFIVKKAPRKGRKEKKQ